MVTIWIPSLLRDLTEGESKLEVTAETVDEAITTIDDRYPGFRNQIVKDNKIIPDLSVVVDGEISETRLRQKLDKVKEIHFLPVISGG